MDKLIKDLTIAIPLKSGYVMVMIGQEELTCIVGLAPRLGTPAMTPLQLSRDFEEKLSRSAYSSNQIFSSERKPVRLRELMTDLLAEIADVDAMLTVVREELDFRYPIAQQAAVMHRIGALLDQRAVLMRKRDGLKPGAGLS